MRQCLRIFPRLAAAVSAAILATAASQASAVTVFPAGLNTSGAATAVTPNDFGRGYSFTVLTGDFWVTDFAWYTPSGPEESYAIALWNLGTETQLAYADGLEGSSTAWSTTSIAPVRLDMGQDYAITLYSATGGLFWTGDPAMTPNSPDLTFNGAQLCFSCSPGTFPDATLEGYSYGLVDIGYQIGRPEEVPLPAQVPLPAGLPLLATGIGGLMLLGRRRR